MNVTVSRCTVLLFLLWSDTVTRQHLPLRNPQLLLDANYCKLQIVFLCPVVVIPILQSNWNILVCLFQTVVFGSYLIAHGFFSVYNMCVDTLFLCFCE